MFVDYYAYIRSDAWRQVKIRYLKSELPNHCYVCHAPWSNALQFHHRSYERLGNELLSDIVPVCQRCHLLIHYIADNLGYDLWAATDEARRRTPKVKPPERQTARRRWRRWRRRTG